MRHFSTRALYAHWNERRGERAAPERGEIDPVAIRHALGDTFMLAADFVDELRFRLAGTRVCALFGRELKGELFAPLWSEDCRQQMESLLTIVTTEKVGAVAGLTARTDDGTETDAELLLLPLAYAGHARIRAVGVLAPIEIPYWAGENPVTELTLGSLRHLGSEVETTVAPRLVPSPQGELRHGFVVYDGGRAAPSGSRTG